ncbi:hypothetical protein C8R44DRAFT_747682 [Mycena epipterygia]|nr:hypothetical protein C8R44DRAFT_747682 [Mycena epipterygia]
MIILELDGVNGVALPPESVADALVMCIGRGCGDEVEGAAHDVLIEEFMCEVKLARRREARNEAAVVGVGGGREPVDVSSEESSPFGHGEGGNAVEREGDILGESGVGLLEFAENGQLFIHGRGLMSHLRSGCGGMGGISPIRAGGGSPLKKSDRGVQHEMISVFGFPWYPCAHVRCSEENTQIPVCQQNRAGVDRVDAQAPMDELSARLRTT